MTKKWWKEAVIYQIYPKSFNDSNGDGIGDLRGIIEKLDYIEELGVDVIWLNPVYKSPNVDNGYDISDYQRIDEQYGSLDDFKELLAKIHEKGMKLIMDMVLNHTSDQHEWFQQAKSAKANKYRDYYIWHKGKNGQEPNNWGNYFYEGAGSAWEYDQKTGEYYLHNYSKKMPDLNWKNENLKQDMFKMLRWWLDMGIDGFRLDAINRLIKPEGLPDSKRPPTPPVGIRGYVVDREMCANQPGIHELLHEMNQEVFSKYNIMTVGETGNVNSDIAINYVKAEKQEIDMVFHFEIAKNPVLVTVPQFKAIQQRWYGIIEQNGWITQYLSNHDSPRQVSRFADDRELHYQSATMLATLLHTLPGTPFIYQGEEIGMTNVEFPSIEYYNERYTVGKYYTMLEKGVSPEEALSQLRMMSRDNARTPMQWNRSENAGFTNGKPWLSVNPNYEQINVEQDLKGKRSIYQYYQKLIDLRKKNSVMVYGNYRPVLAEIDHIVAYIREYEGVKWFILTNFDRVKTEVNIPQNILESEVAVILSNYPESESKLSKTMELKPYQTIVYQLTDLV